MWKHIGHVVEKIRFVDRHPYDAGVRHEKETGTVKGGAAGIESVIVRTGRRRIAEVEAERGDTGQSLQEVVDYPTGKGNILVQTVEVTKRET
jgi:hypothetical protein